jgi:hypothetical protein
MITGGRGKIGLDLQAISEIDINPVNIDPRGNVIAVDARVIPGRKSTTTRRQAVS